ncbi:MAG: PstS family phosphate ABC transporter substrate-binding protein [Pelolinea sp.]|nr:PstS family phosphate ABC transporter substrate-binding protein [Pelolinea sp.]
MFNKSLVVISVIVLGAVFFIACAPAAAPVAEVEEATMANFSGDVLIDGSSTVYPITVAVAEEFSVVQPDVRVSVGLSGTGGGFKKFCIGETDISDASRPIKDSEKEICAQNKIEWTEFLVALDGLTVMVNPENDWLTKLSPEQLGQILGTNSTIVKWSDIDPSFPNENITFFIPDPDSGTRDYMIEVVEDFVGDEDLRQDENTTFSSDDNVLLDGIANELYSFGFFGYAYYINNTDKVRAVSVVNEAGVAILPSDATVQDGSYNPLARPLFIYANNASASTKPQVAEFLKYYISEDGASFIMSDVGYSMPPDGTYETLNDNLTILLAK